MGCVVKLVDDVLFMYFLLLVLIIPLFDGQACIPLKYYPNVLINLNSSDGNEYEDYLVLEKPHFFVGLIWMELCFLWPLSIVNLFGIVFGKSWLNTTCLIYGVCKTTSMVAIISELVGSGKASDKLLQMYYVFMGISMLVVVRGLVCSSSHSPTITKKPILEAGKKKALKRI